MDVGCGCFTEARKCSQALYAALSALRGRDQRRNTLKASNSQRRIASSKV